MLPTDSHYNRRAIHVLNRHEIFGSRFYFPDVLVSVLYSIDPKTGKLAHNAKVYFQPQGAVAAQLAFPEQYLSKDYKNQQFSFEAQMDVTFIDVKVSLTGKVGKEPISGEGSVEF